MNIAILARKAATLQQGHNKRSPKWTWLNLYSPICYCNSLSGICTNVDFFEWHVSWRNVFLHNSFSVWSFIAFNTRHIYTLSQCHLYFATWASLPITWYMPLYYNTDNNTISITFTAFNRDTSLIEFVTSLLLCHMGQLFN